MLLKTNITFFGSRKVYKPENKACQVVVGFSKANWEAYASYWLKNKDLTMSHYLKRQIITKQQKQMNKQNKIKHFEKRFEAKLFIRKYILRSIPNLGIISCRDINALSALFSVFFAFSLKVIKNYKF